MARCSSSSSLQCAPKRLSFRQPPLTVLLLGLFLLSTTPSSSAQQSSPFPSGSQKQAHIHFFFHDIQSGSNPTSIQVVKPPSNSLGSFGSVSMIDNPLTETSDRSSTLVGRAQGLYASASQSDTALLMTLNYAFVSGEFSGSSLAILGRNPVMDGVREMSVVGGTGKLRMARGYALAKTTSFGMGGDAVVEYDVYVVYYENAGSAQTTSTTGVGGGSLGGGSSGTGTSAGSPSGGGGGALKSSRLVGWSAVGLGCWMLLRKA